MDIELHPNYNDNGWIYLSYASSEGKVMGQIQLLCDVKLKITLSR